jgi:hypothetical protein
MTDVNRRLADILADYTAAMNDLECHDDPKPDHDNGQRRVLRPADRQRGCGSPRIGSAATPRGWLT